MPDSYQNELPKARVNITLDVETAEGKKKKELPLKLLVLGDFSNGKSEKPLNERERININKNNFDKVIKDFSPEIHCVVPNKISAKQETLGVKLKMEALRSFHPEEIIKQVPALKNLLAMRNLLKDLKANILDNSVFCRELEKIIKDKPQLQQLKRSLNQLVFSETEQSGDKS
jgi:type VI secretion system protein ImpB